MKKLIFILPMLLLLTSCTSEKGKLAKQNNQLVMSHSKVVKTLKELQKDKSDSDKFFKKAEAFVKIIKEEKTTIANKDVTKKLDKIKEFLYKTLDHLYKGYSSAVDLYKKGKKKEASDLIRKTEQTFFHSTNKLVALQTQMAKSNNIKIKKSAKKSAEKTKNNKKTNNKPKNPAQKK